MRALVWAFRIMLCAGVVVGLYRVVRGGRPEREAVGGAGLVFASTTLNAGQFVTGDSCEFSFGFRNGGKRPVEVTGSQTAVVDASAAEMGLTWDMATDFERQDGILTVVMDFSRLSGLVQDTVDVRTASPDFEIHIPVVAYAGPEE